jgi:ABC-type antimicrobial peptide transport system permease subunit
VVKRGVQLAGVGVALGLVGAWGLAGLLEALLFGVTTTDPLTYGVVAAWLGVGAVVASWMPAWRASRLDPVEVLRSD